MLDFVMKKHDNVKPQCFVPIKITDSFNAFMKLMTAKSTSVRIQTLALTYSWTPGWKPDRGMLWTFLLHLVWSWPCKLQHHSIYRKPTAWELWYLSFSMWELPRFAGRRMAGKTSLTVRPRTVLDFTSEYRKERKSNILFKQRLINQLYTERECSCVAISNNFPDEPWRSTEGFVLLLLFVQWQLVHVSLLCVLVVNWKQKYRFLQRQLSYEAPGKEQAG